MIIHPTVISNILLIFYRWKGGTTAGPAQHCLSTGGFCPELCHQVPVPNKKETYIPVDLISNYLHGLAQKFEPYEGQAKTCFLNKLESSDFRSEAWFLTYDFNTIHPEFSDSSLGL